MRIAVTGAQGQVASALRDIGAERGVEILPLARPEFDLTRPDEVDIAIERLAPDVLISAAAYTAVDLAETNKEEAFQINGEAPAALARATARRGIPILHLSTDYVFDGLKTTPYVETDPIAPRSVYGASKLAGEQGVIAHNPRHVILRTAWVYSHGGKNFVRTMLRLAETNATLRVVSDQFGCPSYAVDLAHSLVSIAENVIRFPEAASKYGIFHMAGSGDTSWAGLAQAIFELAGRRGLPVASVKPIGTADYPTPARRPANSRLDCSALAEQYGLKLPHWHHSLEQCLKRIAGTS